MTNDMFSPQDLRFLAALGISDPPVKPTELSDVYEALEARERELARLTAVSMVDAWWPR